MKSNKITVGLGRNNMTFIDPNQTIAPLIPAQELFQIPLLKDDGELSIENPCGNFSG